jgi:hypothetical protein
MKLNSTLFDRIRVKPEEDRSRAPDAPRCEHPGCAALGDYRAPKGRYREGEYWRFCLDHVRAYNSNYNYFAGMPEEQVADYQKSAMTGHRPTWSMGVNAWRKGAAYSGGAGDTFGFFRDAGFGPRVGTPETPEQERSRPSVRAAERRAFAALDLEPEASADDIKARYKALVKRFHPDANGGDRATEDRFRDIVQAYTLLKSAGFVA